MSRLGRSLPTVVFSLLLLAALFALQCPEFDCSECGADEVAARQGGASLQTLVGVVASHLFVAPLLSAAPLRSIATLSAGAEHSALVSRLRI